MENLKLIALPTSPYAARVKIQVYEKGLNLTVKHPSAVAGALQQASLNPFGKTPILLVGKECITESAAIQEYLEDIHPVPSLRGADALTTAKMRALVRAIDLYFFPILYGLRGLKAGSDQLPEVLQSLHQVLGKLLTLFGGQAYVCGDQLTLADCALAPACYFLEIFLARHGQVSVFERYPVLHHWWGAVNQHQSVSRAIAELEAAINQTA